MEIPGPPNKRAPDETLILAREALSPKHFKQGLPRVPFGVRSLSRSLEPHYDANAVHVDSACRSQVLI